MNNCMLGSAAKLAGNRDSDDDNLTLHAKLITFIKSDEQHLKTYSADDELVPRKGFSESSSKAKYVGKKVILIMWRLKLFSIST